MVIQEVKKWQGTVYHVEDNGCIQEFNTIKGAKDYIAYVKQTDAYEKSIRKMMVGLNNGT